MLEFGTKFLKMFPNFKWFPLCIGWCLILCSECVVPIPSGPLPGQCTNCSRINSKGQMDYNENVACGCHRKPRCTILAMNLDELHYFRLSVVNKHNAIRRKFATGIDDLQSVSNMMEIGQYYGDLEYTSMCSALRCPRAGEQQKCLGTDHFNTGVGQNIWSNWTDREPYKGLSKRQLMDKIIDDALQSWHNQIVYFPRELVSGFIASAEFRKRNRPRNSYDAFTCLYWAKVQQVGCYISMRTGTDDRIIEHILVCNYGDWDFKPCNVRGQPMYIPGTTCTQCPSCNSITGDCCVNNICWLETLEITGVKFEHFVGSLLADSSKTYGHQEAVKKVFVIHSDSHSNYIESSYGFIALSLIISILL